MSNQSNHNRDTHSQAQRLITSDDSSSDEHTDTSLQVTEEERRGTIPGSTVATAMALVGARAQSNPVVERGPPRRRKKTKSVKSTTSEDTQTTDTTKSPK